MWLHIEITCEDEKMSGSHLQRVCCHWLEGLCVEEVQNGAAPPHVFLFIQGPTM